AGPNTSSSAARGISRLRLASGSETANRAGRVLSHATASPGRSATSAAFWTTVSRPASVISTTTNAPSVAASSLRVRVPEHGPHPQSTSARSSIHHRRTHAVKRPSGGPIETAHGRWVADSIARHSSATSPPRPLVRQNSAPRTPATATSPPASDAGEHGEVDVVGHREVNPLAQVAVAQPHDAARAVVADRVGDREHALHLRRAGAASQLAQRAAALVAG